MTEKYDELTHAMRSAKICSRGQQWPGWSEEDIAQEMILRWVVAQRSGRGWFPRLVLIDVCRMALGRVKSTRDCAVQHKFEQYNDVYAAISSNPETEYDRKKIVCDFFERHSTPLQRRRLRGFIFGNAGPRDKRRGIKQWQVSNLLRIRYEEARNEDV